MPSTINVSRVKLIETMKANRETHLKEYNEAKTVYLTDLQKEMIERCSRYLAKVAADVTAGVINHDNRGVFSKLEAPTSYVAEYDNKIAMFDMSVDENIELTEPKMDGDEIKLKVKCLATTFKLRAKPTARTPGAPAAPEGDKK